MTHPRQDPARRCRPVAEWPESDRSAWATAQSAGDILDPGGPAAAWAPHTRRGVVSGWGHFLTWLDQAGELRADETPGARITPPRLTAYVDALRQRGNAIQSILSRLQQLDRFLAAVAPGQDCTPLRRMQARLRGEPHDPGSKRARLRFSRELFDLGTRLMAVAESSPSTARQRAVDYRDGLMIALLAARPLRRRNFVRLELGRHLVHDARRLAAAGARRGDQDRAADRPALPHGAGAGAGALSRGPPARCWPPCAAAGISRPEPRCGCRRTARRSPR